MSAKYTINLLQPELLPEQPLVTLGRVVSFWAITLIVMIAFSAWASQHAEQLSAQSAQLKSEHQKAQETLATLEDKYKASKSDPQLVERLALLKQIMINKQSFYKELTDTNRTYVKGFSMAMTELADLHNRDITLQQVQITNDDLTFSGIARKPDTVPQWLAGFENSSLLAGKSFTKFQLNENEQGITEFVVSTVVGGGSE